MRSESEAGPVGVARCAASHFACTFMTLDMDGAVSGFIGRRRAGGARGQCTLARVFDERASCKRLVINLKAFDTRIDCKIVSARDVVQP